MVGIEQKVGGDVYVQVIYLQMMYADDTEV